MTARATVATPLSAVPASHIPVHRNTSSRCAVCPDTDHVWAWPIALAMRKQVQLPHGGYPYGYAPMASESLAGSLGEEAPADLKETFSIGPLQPPPALPEVCVAVPAFTYPHHPRHSSRSDV